MEFILFFFINRGLHAAVDLFHPRLLDSVSEVLNKDLVNARGLISLPSIKEKKKVC